jgi:hypothetical protein
LVDRKELLHALHLPTHIIWNSFFFLYSFVGGMPLILGNKEENNAAANVPPVEKLEVRNLRIWGKLWSQFDQDGFSPLLTY